MDTVGKMARISGFRFISRVVAATMEVFRLKFPKVVRIETTNHCNARCTFCPRESVAREKRFMDQGLYEKIVIECAKGGCAFLHLHNFGEPLLDRRLPERIRFAKEKGIKWVKIFTNGALLGGPVIERLLHSGLDEIRISMDGGDASEFNALRPGLDHARILRNIADLKRMRDRLGRRRPVIAATCVQTSDNGKTRGMLRGTVDKIIYADLHNWAGERGFSERWHLRQPCFRLWQTFTILVTGQVALCCLDHAGQVILGDCRDQSISEIWESRQYQELRRLHRDSEQDKVPLCSRCSMSFFRPKLPSYLSHV